MQNLHTLTYTLIAGSIVFLGITLCPDNPGPHDKPITPATWQAGQ